jgi:type II secretory pathway pseudopilin PulG
MDVDRRCERGMTAVEAAVAIAIVGSVLAVGAPAFVRELHASRLTEAVSGLERLGAASVASAAGRATVEALPPSAPLTPAVVPRGVLVVDPPGTWDAPAWKALDFRATPEGTPHAFAFSFDSSLGSSRSEFVARAHGDLNGNGVTSTFEIRGHASGSDPAGMVLEPGMYVESETE